MFKAGPREHFWDIDTINKNRVKIMDGNLGSSEAERPLLQFERSGPLDQLESSTSTATSTNESIVSSIEQFQTDFTEMKCKMKIFGESLNLCKCIAFDFKSKIKTMDKRLRGLEKRVHNERTQSNYSAIIKKNKQLSNKSILESKKLQMCTTEEEMKRVAGKICRNYLPGVWKTIDSADLEFRKITGGLSNFLYYVALPTDASKTRYEPSDSNLSLDGEGGGGFVFDEPKKVLLRIYGQVHGERAMDAIVTESVIFTLLSERRLGPKLYGVFSGGRIEEFIPTRCLLTKELRDPALSMKIAEKMAAIHSMDVPLNKEPNYIWKTMNKWLKTVKEDRLAGNKAKNEAEQHIIRSLKLTDFEQEVEFLKRLVNSVDSPVVFCHNDLQEGNILYMEEVEPEPPVDEDYVTSYVQTFDDTENAPEEIQEKVTLVEKNTRAPYMETIDDGNTTDSHISDSGEPKLYLIDFEYCAYNYRGFDIANHFQEWMYDYTNEDAPFYFFEPENVPTLEQKEIFIKEYLKHYNANQSEGQSTQDVAVTVTQLNKLLTEVEAFAMVSHLFWGLWAIVNAGKSTITFGYWEYALNRIEMYLRLKQEFLKDESTNRASKRKICEVDI